MKLEGGIGQIILNISWRIGFQILWPRFPSSLVNFSKRNPSSRTQIFSDESPPFLPLLDCYSTPQPSSCSGAIRAKQTTTSGCILHWWSKTAPPECFPVVLLLIPASFFRVSHPASFSVIDFSEISKGSAGLLELLSFSLSKAPHRRLFGQPLLSGDFSALPSGKSSPLQSLLDI